MANISKITYKGVTYDIYDASAVHSVTPYSLPVATYNVLGGVKPLYSNTGAVTGVTAASGAKTVAVNAISTTTGRYYAVEIDKDGRLYVNIPWTDPTSVYQTHSGTWDTTNGYKITLSGSNSEVTVPFFVAGTSGGLAKQPAAGDTGKFLRGDNTWATPTDTNYQYTLGGNLALPSGYKVTLTGSNGGSNSETTVPVMVGASINSGGSAGLVPTPSSGDQIKFLRGDGTWQIVDLESRAHHIWYFNSNVCYGSKTSGQGNWEATFPLTNALIGASSGLKSLDNYSGSPAVNDTIITKGGFIGYLSSYDDPAWSATFIGRLDFMAYDHNGTLSAQNGTGYDSATSTLILGEY